MSLIYEKMLKMKTDMVKDIDENLSRIEYYKERITHAEDYIKQSKINLDELLQYIRVIEKEMNINGGNESET